MNEIFSGNTRIARIEWAPLEGKRPRSAGSNARLGDHGLTVRLPIARITDSDGATGWGVSRVSRELAEACIGLPLGSVCEETGLLDTSYAPLEYPFYDLVGKRSEKPVYQLLASEAPNKPLRVPCYDTSLYFDDLHLDDDKAAVELIAKEARDGWARGHRSFKIKVGRGARHMDLEKGTRRDIAIIRAIREVAGPDGKIMIDANNGYNLNLTKRVLEETQDCNLFWLEEAFHEDAVLYRDLKEWMVSLGIKTLIADGEGEASPSLMRWAMHDGLIDVVQYDVFSSGFGFWVTLGDRIKAGETAGGPVVSTAPHHYGMHLGNYVTGHLASRLPRLLFAEWDEAETPGIDGSAYRIEEGQIVVPDAPGFGLGLDETLWTQAVKNNGFVASQPN